MQGGSGGQPLFGLGGSGYPGPASAPPVFGWGAARSGTPEPEPPPLAPGLLLSPPSVSSSAPPLEQENRLLKRAVAILTGRLQAMEGAVAEVASLRDQVDAAQGTVRDMAEALRKERLARYTAEAHLRAALGEGAGGGSAPNPRWT